MAIIKMSQPNTIANKPLWLPKYIVIKKSLIFLLKQRYDRMISNSRYLYTVFVNTFFRFSTGSRHNINSISMNLFLGKC